MESPRFPISLSLAGFFLLLFLLFLHFSLLGKGRSFALSGKERLNIASKVAW